jgi:hypothetical protein
VTGLDKKSLVRGLNTADVFEKKEGKEEKEEGKKVTRLIENWRDSMGSNDN